MAILLTKDLLDQIRVSVFSIMQHFLQRLINAGGSEAVCLAVADGMENYFPNNENFMQCKYWLSAVIH